jgi:ankyrin repeat protein
MSYLKLLNHSLLPIHVAASCNTVAVVQLLLNEDAGSALETDWRGNNLLHYALSDQSNVIDIVLEKVNFLATKHPKLLDGYNQCGFTPYQNYLTYNPKMRLMSCLILAEGHIVKSSGRKMNMLEYIYVYGYEIS